jgi:ABC-type sugar transport system ATPase subunit
MNAYKLANALDEYNKDGMPVLVVSQAVDKLRQQADRIIDLEMTSDTGKIADLLQHQADYIDFLEKALDSSIKLNKAQAERKT